jgi:hypothetical protein
MIPIRVEKQVAFIFTSSRAKMEEETSKCIEQATLQMMVRDGEQI